MADIQHSAITDPQVHEPKGASTASANTVYVSNGAGSGTWQVLTTDSLDFADIVTEIQADLDDGTLDITGRYWIYATIADISTASSIIVPVIRDSTVLSARGVLGGPITVANAEVTFTNAAAASMGTPLTVTFTGSAKGDGYTFTATGNNVLVGPTWFEIATDGGSTDAQPFTILIELETIINL